MNNKIKITFKTPDFNSTTYKWLSEWAKHTQDYKKELRIKKLKRILNEKKA